MTKQPSLAVKPQNTANLSEMFHFFIPQSNINVGVVERLASLVVGATVVLIVVRRFLLYGMFILTGAYLLYRGITGYCPLYASEQIDTRQWRPSWSRIGELWPFINRSKNHEQDNSTRQMATYARQPEDGVGPVDGE
jgi:hypothetical protein